MVVCVVLILIFCFNNILCKECLHSTISFNNWLESVVGRFY